MGAPFHWRNETCLGVARCNKWVVSRSLRSRRSASSHFEQAIFELLHRHLISHLSNTIGEMLNRLLWWLNPEPYKILNSRNIVVSDDFYVIIESTDYPFGYAIYDNPSSGPATATHSFWGPTLNGLTNALAWINPPTYADLLIRAEIARSSTPSNPYHYVGGEVFAANKLAVISPYLTLISIVAVAAVLVKRRKS
jgi:hypothetical protein